MLAKCPKCSGHVDPITRADKTFFYYCRACKLPFSPQGRVVIDTRTLNSSFNPVRVARAVTGKGLPSDMSPLAKTALEGLLISALLEAYSGGLKDGILLSYSQDVADGKPTDEGV